MKLLFVWASLLGLGIQAQDVSPVAADPLLTSPNVLKPNFGLIDSNADRELFVRDLEVRQGPKLSDEEVMDKWANTGQCFWYFSGGARHKGIDACKKFCDKEAAEEGKEPSGWGCNMYIPEGKDESDIRPILYDRDDDKYSVGQCMCECELCEYVRDLVIEFLKVLDNIICAAWLSAVMGILEVGTDFIPGGKGAKQALGALVEGAKSFAENEIPEGSLFTSWIGPACGVPDFNFSVDKVFGDLLEFPDSVGKSVGCKKKNKASCRKLDSKPDSTKKADDEAPPVNTKKDDDGQKSTAKSTSPTTTEHPSETLCGSCSGEEVKLEAREDRWGRLYGRASGRSCPWVEVMDEDGDGDEACTVSGGLPGLPGLSDVPDLGGAADGALGAVAGAINILDDRALEKRGSTKSMYLNINGKRLRISFGTYNSCTKAETDDDIEDKFIYFKSDICFEPELVKTAKSKVPHRVPLNGAKKGKKKGGIEFATEHVYEPQMLRDFIEWLADGGTTGTHQKPSGQWVEHVLVVPSTAHRFTNPLLGADAVAGTDFWSVITYGFGRSDGKGRPKKVASKDFTVLDQDINLNKASWHGGKKTGDIQGHSLASAQRMIKYTAGTWQYHRMTNLKNGETIWDKWMRTSNWIDMVLHEFDDTYSWGADPALVAMGEPKRTGAVAAATVVLPAGVPTPPTPKNPSLRALYAFWIDDHLKSIEKKADEWAKDAKKKFDQKFKGKGSNAAHNKFMKTYFDWRTGALCNEKIEFPRQTGQPSDYGAWGNEGRTFDAQGNKLNPYIGPPPAV